MPRVLLILPTATYRAPDFLAAAASLSVDVVVGSEAPQALSGAMGDRAVVVDLADPSAAVEEIVALHRRSPLDAVVAVDDQGVLVANLAAARLGLTHNSPEAVAATRDKLAMRRRLAEAGVAQPEFRAAAPSSDLAALAAEVGWPCVLKPLPLSASRGVIRADDAAAALAAAARIRVILAEAGEDPHGPVLVERFLPGAEVAVEGLLRNGVLEVLAVFDKPDPLDGPYFEETIYVTPSRLDADVLAAVERQTAAAASSLGLREGPVHAELRIGGGRLAVLELAARSIGGRCARALRFGTGVSLEEIILRHALGHDLDGLQREQAAAGVMMLPIPASGILDHVGGQEEARAVPGIVGLELSINPKRPVRPLPEGDRYLGFLFARATTPHEVEAALRTAHACLDVAILAAPR
ncbi:MAG: ATP-grasp domain-containing protein [Actinomycetota bacterium]|nr:ATP-grasp domain-containing protein [Actinomycetota bacterium]